MKRVLKVRMELDGTKLTMHGAKRRESLAITGEYPRSFLAEMLFSQLGTMHLAAPYLPNVIETDFFVVPEIRTLIDAMYASEHRHPPNFKSPVENVAASFSLSKTNPKRVAVAFSAGKDSLWNAWWAQEKYGSENVLIVHVAGLNRSNASGERKYAELQAKKFGFKNFRIIELHNGSIETGFKVMRSRDMFLVGAIAPVAIEFGASKIITEGFGEATVKQLFTGEEKNMRYFNGILHRLGIPIEVAWRNRKEMDVMKDLAVHRPEWLPYIHNCFAPPCYKPSLQRSWQKRTPTFPPLDSQCGSCMKCRITRLGVLLYGEHEINPADAAIFLRHTEKWIGKKWSTHEDMLNGSFLENFRMACKRYGIKAHLRIPSAA